MNSDPVSRDAGLWQTLNAYFEKQEGLRLEALSTDKTIQRPFSQISFLTAETSAGKRKLVAKRIVHHTANLDITLGTNQALVEYSTLVQLYPQFIAVPGCSVPKPIAVMPEEESYVMEYIEGTQLTQLLDAARIFASSSNFQELARYYHLSGRWLNRLQRFTHSGAGGLEALEWVLQRLNVKLAELDASPNGTKPAGFSRIIRDFVTNQLARLDAPKIPVAGRHGDFGAWNIITKPGEVIVLDFLGFGRGPICLDVLKMLINLHDEKHYLGYSAHRVRRLQESFLSGFESCAEVPAAAALLCEAFHRTCSILAITTAAPKGIRWRLERKPALVAHIEWFTHAEKQSSLWPKAV